MDGEGWGARQEAVGFSSFPTQRAVWGPAARAPCGARSEMQSHGPHRDGQRGDLHGEMCHSTPPSEMRVSNKAGPGQGLWEMRGRLGQVAAEGRSDFKVSVKQSRAMTEGRGWPHSSSVSTSVK